MSWDHNVKWCIIVTGTAELDFHFSIIQTLMGYQAFNKGVSKLKQVTGREHHAVQHYIIALNALNILACLVVWPSGFRHQSRMV